MAVNNPYAKYKQSSVETKSAGELTLMLYEGCLKFIKRAEKGINEKNIEEKNTNLIKAQNIIRELMVTLNTDVEVSKNMMQMYDFIITKLIEANTGNDLEALKQAEQFVVEFRDTWKEVIKLDRQQRYSKEKGASPTSQETKVAPKAGASQQADSRSKGQPLAKITPEKKLVEKSELNGNSGGKKEQAKVTKESILNDSGAKQRQVPVTSEKKAAPNNPYATATKKAANPNNPYTAAKKAAALAGVGSTFRR